MAAVIIPRGTQDAKAARNPIRAWMTPDLDRCGESSLAKLLQQHAIVGIERGHLLTRDECTVNHVLSYTQISLQPALPCLDRTIDEGRRTDKIRRKTYSKTSNCRFSALLLTRLSSPTYRQISPGKSADFPLMSPPHLRSQPSVVSDFASSCKLVRLRPPDAVRVPQRKDLPPASLGSISRWTPLPLAGGCHDHAPQRTHTAKSAPVPGAQETGPP